MATATRRVIITIICISFASGFGSVGMGKLYRWIEGVPAP